MWMLLNGSSHYTTCSFLRIPGMAGQACRKNSAATKAAGGNGAAEQASTPPARPLELPQQPPLCKAASRGCSPAQEVGCALHERVAQVGPRTEGDEHQVGPAQELLRRRGWAQEASNRAGQLEGGGHVKAWCWRRLTQKRQAQAPPGVGWGGEGWQQALPAPDCSRKVASVHTTRQGCCAAHLVVVLGQLLPPVQDGGKGEGGGAGAHRIKRLAVLAPQAEVAVPAAKQVVCHEAQGGHNLPA